MTENGIYPAELLLKCHSKFAYGFPRWNWEKLLIKIRNLAFRKFYQSLKFYSLYNVKSTGT